MCGIVGFWEQKQCQSALDRQNAIGRMTATLVHRGPNDGGTWCDDSVDLALGHRRLSILDLSPAGHQPMFSASGRFAIVYNGEIYNSDELRRDLKNNGITFRGHSDTEALLEGCAAWGVEATVRRCIGMFAFALWDKESRTLWLVRDRLGIKPLYWGQMGGTFLFASELKALKSYPGWHGQVNRDAVAALLTYCYIPGPLSIYEGVHKLQPGHILELREGAAPRINAYWSALDVMLSGAANRHEDMTDDEAKDSLEALLRDAVKRRMVADVPLGAFLSGGIDSSLVVAMMQAQSENKIRTFSIGFEEASYNEAPYARAVAEHLGTEHTEMYVTPKDAWDVIPSLPDLYDEPFADSSQIPTYLLSKLTQKHVTIALSGDGGDELFAGYTRYFLGLDKYAGISPFQNSMRSLLHGSIRLLNRETWDHLGLVAPSRWRHHLGNRLYCHSEWRRPEEYFRDSYLTHWPNATEIVPGSALPKTVLRNAESYRRLPWLVERFQYMDVAAYLPDDILVKVDRASMAVGLEARVPLLDHRVFELAWSLPRRMSIRDGKGKWILRQILYKYVPSELIERPKMGFGVPIDEWLRGPLRDWAESLLNERRLHQEGFFQPAPIREMWQRHLAGEGWHYFLWDILMFQAWLEKNGSH